MYLIILAAGRGNRLRPLTDSRPKCMVEVGGRALLDWQLAVARKAGMRDIAIIRGYKKEAINRAGITYFENAAYDTTNMVDTLWYAESIFDEGFIVSYGDIIYTPLVLEQLLKTDDAINVVVDKGWQSYWEQRFENVLNDAETLEVDVNGRIISIGQHPISLEQIRGQYIGLTAFRREGVDALRSVYQQAQRESAEGRYPLRGQRPLHKLYMTDILQGIIDSGFPVNQVAIQRGWLEIDSLNDLELAERSIEIHGDMFTITG